VPEFETTAQGCRIATSVGGVLTGRGADIIIIDDPLQPEATGAGMEVTKCLKPPDSGHEVGDRASVQAAT